MASFADAIINSMVAQMDPAVAMQRDAMQGYLEVQKGHVSESKGKTVLALTAQLLELKGHGFADDSIPVVSINKLISSLSD